MSCLTILLLAGALNLPAPLLQSAEEAPEIRMESAVVPTQTWLGRQWNANRFQDWALKDGKIECMNSQLKDPIRTAIWLPDEVQPQGGPISFSVEVHRPGDQSSLEESSLHAGSFAGLIFGIGGPEVDHRIRSIVHDKPAEDGGILATVDARGRVYFRDFSTGGGGGSWSVSGPLKEGMAEKFPDQVHTVQANEKQDTGLSPGVWKLTLDLLPQDDLKLWTVTLISANQQGEEVSRSVLKNLTAQQIDGSFGLVSHLGDKNRRGGWSFSSFEANGIGLVNHRNRLLGPIFGLQYSLSRNPETSSEDPSSIYHEWNLTAQLAPVAASAVREAWLEVQSEDGDKGPTWTRLTTGTYEALSQTLRFRVPRWSAHRTLAFRVKLLLGDSESRQKEFSYNGIVRAEPELDGRPVRIGLISCVKNFTGKLAWNSSSIWYPHEDVARGLLSQDPDLVFFAGDQIYEGDITRAEVNPPDRMLLDYHTKYLRWYRAFGELTRSRPTIQVPDDHDVYHGNIWGAGGKRARREKGMTAQDSGGYKLAPREVNAIHLTQTSHLPAPCIEGPIGEGYSVYTTRVEYAGLSMAVISDRQFKSAPRPSLPEGDVVNGWFRNPEFDPVKDADAPGLDLLGSAQEKFLANWSLDWSRGARWKVLLSQTPFVNVATLPPGKTGAVIPGLPIPKPGGWPEGEAPVADCDSGGWPQSARNRAVSLLRDARAFHLAGDQHLASCVRYGVENFRDAGVVFAGPAVANTWPRRWFPSVAGGGKPVSPLRGTGDFRDGFGNAMTVLAVGNPSRTGHEPERLHDRGPGWGLVHVDLNKRTATFECWPRFSTPGKADAEQYPGWPITVDQRSLDGRKPHALLPNVESGDDLPIAHIWRVGPADEKKVLVSAYRLKKGESWNPPVHQPGSYQVQLLFTDGREAWGEVVEIR